MFILPIISFCRIIGAELGVHYELCFMHYELFKTSVLLSKYLSFFIFPLSFLLFPHYELYRNCQNATAEAAATLSESTL